MFEKIQLNRMTVQRRVTALAANIEEQLVTKSKSFEYLSMALDESSEISSIVQLNSYFYKVQCKILRWRKGWFVWSQGEWHAQSSSGKMIHNGFEFNENSWNYDWRNHLQSCKWILISNCVKRVFTNYKPR